MADAVLQRGVEFGRALPAFRIEEHRVVAEAAGAARRVQHPAVPAAFGDQRRRVLGMTQQHEASVEMGFAPVVGHVRELGQQTRVCLLYTSRCV